jgi:hypothetical protein
MINIENFNIILPVAYKDFDFLKRTIKYVKKNICPSKIYIILDTRLLKYLPSSVKNAEGVIVVDENRLVRNLSFKRVQSLLEKHGAQSFRSGWYLQQFLKLGFVTSSNCDTEYYLSWDADTIPLRHINFFTTEEHPFTTIKKEYNESYFLTLNKLLNLTKIADYSFIAEHMMFKKTIMKEMLREIEKSTVAGCDWIEKIINATNPNDVNSFSEFETYGNYALNHYPNLYVPRQLNTFRKAGYIAGRFISDRKLDYMGFDLDTASFELSDYACGVNKIGTVLYSLWIEYKEKLIKKMIIK